MTHPLTFCTRVHNVKTKNPKQIDYLTSIVHTCAQSLHRTTIENAVRIAPRITTFPSNDTFLRLNTPVLPQENQRLACHTRAHRGIRMAFSTYLQGVTS